MQYIHINMKKDNNKINTVKAIKALPKYTKFNYNRRRSMQF